MMYRYCSYEIEYAAAADVLVSSSFFSVLIWLGRVLCAKVNTHFRISFSSENFRWLRPDKFPVDNSTHDNHDGDGATSEQKMLINWIN